MVKESISHCISGLSVSFQIPNKKNLKEEEFGLAYSSGYVVSLGGEGVAAADHIAPTVRNLRDGCCSGGFLH